MKFSVKAAASVSSLLSSTSAQSLCSCSPRKYAFTLSLSQACGDDTIQNSPGVFTTICSTDTNLEAYDDWSDLIPDVGESLVRRALHGKHKRQMATDHMTPVKIISIVFAEVNLDGSLVIINKDESFAGVDLHDGAVVEFDSISSALDPSVGIEDQLSSVPGGVTVLLVGENASGDLVKSQILWLYTNDCSTVPLVEAGSLGWISIVSWAHEHILSDILRCCYSNVFILLMVNWRIHLKRRQWTFVMQYQEHKVKILVRAIR